MLRKLLLSIFLGGMVTLLIYIVLWSTGRDLDESPKPNPLETRNLEIMMKFINDKEGSNTLVFFVTYDCPLCKNYRYLIHKLCDSLGNLPNWKVLVYREDVPDSLDGDSKLIYKERYSDFDVQDSSGLMATIFGATVTPEVFLLDSNFHKAYQGAIDNWSYDTGKHRPMATEFYLRNAIKQLSEGQRVSPSETVPVGCFIENTETR